VIGPFALEVRRILGLPAIGSVRSLTLRSKLRSVGRDPLPEPPCGPSRHFLDRRRDERRLSDGGSLGVEQFGRDVCWHARKPFTSGFVRRKFFDDQRAANRAADRGNLFVLTEGLWPGQDIFHSGMSILR
jgi:hypothetical protein